MPFTIEVRHGPFLKVIAAGEATVAELLSVIDVAARVSAVHPYRRGVVDLRAVDAKFSFTDHLTIGMHAASALRHLERAASVVPERLRVGTSEKAAQKEGLLLRTFTDPAAADAWLLEEPSAGGRD